MADQKQPELIDRMWEPRRLIEQCEQTLRKIDEMQRDANQGFERSRTETCVLLQRAKDALARES